MNKAMHPKWALSVATALLISAVTADSVAAQHVLRANSQWSETHTGSIVDKWWADEIRQRTNGEVDIRMFFGGSLGAAEENLSLLQTGAIDIAMMSPGYYPAELPFHAAPNSIPMAMSTVEQATELMEKLFDQVPAFDAEAREMGMKTLFFHHLNPYQLVCREKVEGVADLRGKKIRTWGRELPMAMEAVGATPVTMFLPDLYEGMARGTVDCIPFSTDLMVTYSMHEVAKHIHDITIWLGPTNATWISLRAWDKLTPEQQAIVQEVSREAMYRDRDVTIEAGNEAIATLRAAGVQFHEFPEEEAAKWRELNPDFFALFIEDMGRRGLGADAERTIEIWRSVIE